MEPECSLSCSRTGTYSVSGEYSKRATCPANITVIITLIVFSEIRVVRLPTGPSVNMFRHEPTATIIVFAFHYCRFFRTEYTIIVFQDYFRNLLSVLNKHIFIILRCISVTY